MSSKSSYTRDDFPNTYRGSNNRRSRRPKSPIIPEVNDETSNDPESEEEDILKFRNQIEETIKNLPIDTITSKRPHRVQKHRHHHHKSHHIAEKRQQNKKDSLKITTREKEILPKEAIPVTVSKPISERNQIESSTTEKKHELKNNSNKNPIKEIENKSKLEEKIPIEPETTEIQNNIDDIEQIDQNKDIQTKTGRNKYSSADDDDLFHTMDLHDFNFPQGYLNKAPLPPKSPTFSFRSTIDLLPSSRERHGLRQLLISTTSSSLGPLACGFVLAFMIAKSPQQQLGFDFGAWRVYVFLFGCIAGGFLSSVLINFARKKSLILSMVVLSCSWLLVIFATKNWMLIFHQIISGSCTGIILAVTQIYVGEISSSKHRGAVSCVPILAFHVGMLLCYLLSEMLSWQYLAIVGVSITMPFFFSTLLCMPESPRYLIFIRPNDALATLQWIRGIENEVMDEYKDMASSYVYDRWDIRLDEIALPSFWRPLLISCGLMFFYNFCGIYSFTTYADGLFGDVLVNYDNSAMVVVTGVMVIGITISSLLMDVLGRKLILLLSLTIMAATAFTMGLFLFLKDLHKVESYFIYQWAAEVFCVVLFTFAHGSGIGPITWVTMSEIFSPKYKWISASAASMIFWSSMVAADACYNKMRFVVEIGGVFWFHCVICVAGYIFVLLLFKEMKEQSLDRIPKTFNKRHDRLIDTFIARV